LIASGAVTKAGSTRSARYFAPGQAPQGRQLAHSLELQGLDESRTYDEIAARLNLEKSLKPHVANIFQYAFTEMLNNVIEHSKSDGVRTIARVDPGVAFFEIRDAGIGVFHSIAEKFELNDEHAAMVELVKGRTTTMPKAHTGEGIFFTSRAADRFVLRSHRIQLEWDRARSDTFVSQRRFLRGTTVQFTIRRDSRHRLGSVFSEFAPEEYDYRFERTSILVRLLQKEYISRSEARRLTANLEKYVEVVLDFEGVKSIGQGFADEVFRVFADRHPATAITAVNAGPAVSAMLRHAGARPESAR
jgi:anti-sigma regulatory factor (Ser/Thr protein kinase)